MEKLNHLEECWRGLRQDFEKTEETITQLRHERDGHAARVLDLENDVAELHQQRRSDRKQIEDLNDECEGLRDENEKLNDKFRRITEMMTPVGPRKRKHHDTGSGPEQAHSGERELQFPNGAEQAVSPRSSVPAEQRGGVKLKLKNTATNTTPASPQIETDKSDTISQPSRLSTEASSRSMLADTSEKQSGARSAHANHAETAAVISTSLADLMPAGFSVKLGSGIADDESSERCSIDQLAPNVKQTLKAIFTYAKDKYGENWAGRLRSTAKCIYTAAHGSATFWVVGSEKTLGCKRCFDLNQACVSLGRMGSTFLVLPLAPTVRAADAQPGTDAFYINLDKNRKARNMPNAPWSSQMATAKDINQARETVEAEPKVPEQAGTMKAFQAPRQPWSGARDESQLVRNPSFGFILTKRCS